MATSLIYKKRKTMITVALVGKINIWDTGYKDHAKFQHSLRLSKASAASNGKKILQKG